MDDAQDGSAAQDRDEMHRAHSDAPLLTERHGGVLVLTLNRPEKLNALDPAIFESLGYAVRAYADDASLRVCLLRATGRYFCAGADLLGGTAVPPTESTAAIRHWYRTTLGPGMQALYDDMEAIEKPFVAAHHAPCVGGGLELSLACDFRLAARSARYAFPEAKLGAIPASGGVSRLTRLVGAHWAKWMILANEPVDAARALAIGLVHDVYDDSAFEDNVFAFCDRLAQVPPEMCAMAKLTIGLIEYAAPDHARRIERLGQSVLEVGCESADLLAVMQTKLKRQA